MSNNQKCTDCERYKDQGHNYCQMCGCHLTEGYAPYARVAVAFNTSEKFCGYCGGQKNGCSCV